MSNNIVVMTTLNAKLEARHYQIVDNKKVRISASAFEAITKDAKRSFVVVDAKTDDKKFVRITREFVMIDDSKASESEINYHLHTVFTQSLLKRDHIEKNNDFYDSFYVDDNAKRDTLKVIYQHLCNAMTAFDREAVECTRSVIMLAYNTECDQKYYKKHDDHFVLEDRLTIVKKYNINDKFCIKRVYFK
ncbi:MAG: hypothetical protein ACRDCE_07885 [Cetobacterium sp.]|uniref:hypothetical protein n=1 Tax=Cetobacterium sp. TaxID=2071632 RepID=UPI003EE80F29